MSGFTFRSTGLAAGPTVHVASGLVYPIQERFTMVHLFQIITPRWLYQDMLCPSTIRAHELEYTTPEGIQFLGDAAG